MQNFSPPSLPSSFVPQGDKRVPSYLATRPHQKSTVLRWWYYLASPSEPEENATLKEMERFRRGRTGSQIILAFYVLLIVAIPAGFVGTNIYLIPIVIASALALILGTILNRLGYVNFAGTIVVLTFVGFPVANIVGNPDGLSMLTLPLYGLLVLPLLGVISFLPPWWVFVMAVVNSLFTVASLMYLPRTAELSAILSIAYAGVLAPIILSQFIVSIVAYAWVRSSNQASVRADQAEELARLEHDLAVQAEVAAQRQQQLEASIQKIVMTHIRVANGDLDARIPLTEDNVLWQISGSLNTLLARAQRWRLDAAEVQQARVAVRQMREENTRLKRELGRNYSSW